MSSPNEPRILVPSGRGVVKLFTSLGSIVVLIKLQAKTKPLYVASILARLFLSGLKLAHDSQYLFHAED